ncbi:P-loop containing nucleoside triphosphate hydrolase protein, partial [Circinella umbellata]
LQFPTSEKIQAFGKNRTQLKRTKTVPSNFRNSIQYRDTFQKIIHEHLQLLLYTYGGAYFNIYKNIGQKKNELERTFRSKGIGFYASIEMQSQGRVSIQERYRLKLCNREHHSKYSKDDIWVISKNPTFDASCTFLSKSIFYGPFSDGYLEVECLTSRDARVATILMNGNKSTVYALRTISANNEFMMLDALQDKLDHLPLLPYLLCDDKRRNRKRKTQEDLLPVTNLHYINITREDNLDIEQKLQEYNKRYHLNEDQQSVLRQIAKSVIVAPNWNQEPDSPITLVHGVFGSGKSYLAAVIIIFLRDIVDSVNSMREPDDLILFRILIYSMTVNKLGYDSFIRVGSLKKISKSILPYTIRAKMSSNEELKELEHMLEDPQNSEEDIELIASTIQKFRKTENTMQLQNMDVVGTTCMASTFDIFGNTSFSLALVDEASQLTEPMSMVPLTRFGCSRLIMIGDPLQLPPTVSTTAEEEKIGQGLDKTLFDRLTECHPAISSISNHLFYSRQLQDGITVEDRKPLIEGLPNLMFIDIGGQEQRNFRNNSFSNEAEASIATYIIEALIGLDISPNDIGVISLYKEQADKMIEFIGNRSERKQSVQVSTVDAFQGGEKEVIILSTVRTTNSSFIDNYPRVNVAVTRARRHLIILGKQTLLLNNVLWGNIVMRCQGKYRNS